MPVSDSEISGHCLIAWIENAIPFYTASWEDVDRLEACQRLALGIQTAMKNHDIATMELKIPLLLGRLDLYNCRWNTLLGQAMDTNNYSDLEEILSGTSKSRSTVHEDFIQGYEGAAAAWLHKALIRAREGLNMYPIDDQAAILPIIQTSGSGKSRAVLQLTTKELGLVLCTRKPSDIHLAPPPDKQVYEDLVIPKERDLETEKILVASWLAAACEEMVAFYQPRRGALTWDAFVTSMGSILHNNIVNNFQLVSGMSPSTSEESVLNSNGPSVLPQPMNSARENLLDRIATKKREYFRELDETNQYRNETKLITWLQEKISRIERLLANEQSACMFIAFDEAATMGSRLLVLRDLMRRLHQNKFWILLLDTNNFLSTLADASDLEPFVHFPQDLFLGDLSEICQAKTVKIDKIYDLLPFMGRACWRDRRYHPGKPSHIGHPHLSLPRVMDKLLNHDLTGSRKAKMSLATEVLAQTNRLVGIMSQRIPLEFVGGRGLRSLTGARGGVVSSFAPSEPALSLAATHLFRHQPIAMWDMAIKTLGSRMSYLKDAGEKGEELARLMISVAVDQAATRSQANVGTIQRYSNGDSNWPRHLKPVKFSTFLQELYGLDVDATGEERNRYVNFTHFARTNVNINTDNAMDILKLGVIRQCAWMSNQQGFDIFVPTFLLDKNNEIDFDSLSYVAIQTKFGKSAAAAVDWKNDLAPFVRVTPQREEKLHWNIWLDLGIEKLSQDQWFDRKRKKWLGCLYMATMPSFPCFSKLSLQSQQILTGISTKARPDIQLPAYQEAHNNHRFYYGKRIDIVDKA
jgi:hypothetical protein